MYICLCKGITDKQLEEAQKTSKSIQEIYKKLGLGSECGTCIGEALANFREAKAAQKTSKINNSKNR